MSTMEEKSLGIADAVDMLRKELTQAINRGDREALRFKVNGIDLELSVACEISAGGKASFKVLGIGAELNAGGKEVYTHKVKLSLVPSDASKEGNTLVTDINAERPK